MNIYKIFPFFLFLIFIFFSKCDTTEPPPDNRKLTLVFEDASCTEVWLSLTTENLQLPASINIFIDDSLSQISILITQDSLFYIDSLLPNQTYKFQSIIQPFNQSSEVKSNELFVSTMDTTSHNFTWQTRTFGDIGSSVLYDVAIINKNNIWAVGEINIADTSANGYTKYCYLKWNGIQWGRGILKYFPPGSIGDSITTTGHSIIAFDENDVWISGGAIFHWNGTQWKIYYNTGLKVQIKFGVQAMTIYTL